MGRKAGIISIDLVAGTAKFNADMAQASAQVKQFGTHAVSGTQAASGAIRTLEGNVQNNVRAVERFLVTTLKLGPVLQAAFPIVGAVAFGGLVYKMGEEVVQFFSKISQAPKLIAGAFRELGQPLQLTNDALAVSNLRLQSEIDKLEGRRQNTLALALAEAQEAADKLADSLDKDIGKIEEVLKQQGTGIWESLLTGGKTTGELTDYFKRYRDRMSDPSLTANDKLNVASKAQDFLAAQRATAKGLEGPVFNDATKKFAPGPLSLAGASSPGGQSGPNQDKFIALVDQLSGQVAREASSISLQTAHGDLEGSHEKAQAQHDAMVKVEAQAKRVRTEIEGLNRQLAETGHIGQTGFQKLDEEQGAYLQKLSEQFAEGELTQEQVLAITAANVKLYDAKRVDAYVEAMIRDGAELGKLREQWTRLSVEMRKAGDEARAQTVSELGRGLEERARQIEKLVSEMGKLNQAVDAESLGHAVRMIGIGGDPNDPLGTLAKQQAKEREEIELRYQNSQKTEIDNAKRLLELHRLDNEMEEKTAEVRKEQIERAAQPYISGLSGAAADLATGKKVNIGEVIKSAVRSTIQQAIERELNKLLFHKKQGPTFRAGDPGHVIVDNPTQSDSQQAPGKPAAPGKGGIWAGILGAIGAVAGIGIGSKAGSSSTESVSSSIDYGGERAAGGLVSANKAYLVGERGTELLMGASGRIANATETRRALSGGGGGDTYIDARGADLGAAARISRVVEASHGSAVITANRVSAERAKRTPQRQGANRA